MTDQAVKPPESSGRGHVDEAAAMAALSHALAEPLRKVSAYLSLLSTRSNGALDDESREYLDYAVDGARRMHAMVVGMGRLTRLLNEPAPAVPVACDSALAEALRRLSAKLHGAGGTLQSAPLPPVLAPPDHLLEMLVAGLDNAIKFRSPARPLVIRVSGIREGPRVVLSIEDNGIGLRTADLPRLFRPFATLHARGAYEGLGLGLVTVRGLAQRAGGDAWMEPGLDAGTTLKIALPHSGEVVGPG